MSRVVLVHGIGQRSFTAADLHQSWVSAIARGLRASGRHALADSLDSPAGRTSIAMVYYADLYDELGSQGASANPTEWDTLELALADELAEAWLNAAAERAPSAVDRAAAHRDLEQRHGSPQAQGPVKTLRPVIESLARIRWFAVPSVALAERFIVRALREVSSYIANLSIRTAACQRVLDEIGEDTQLVIGHSLGSVVAYESLHQSSASVAFLTIGSPLGLRHVIYDRLQPVPPTTPAAVLTWRNIVDLDDIVAIVADLTPMFPPAIGSISPVTYLVKNGSRPHSADRYLRDKTTADAIAEVLSQ